MANETEYKNYLFFNSNINVDVLRLDRDTSISLDGVNKDGKDIYALTQEKSITADTILFNTFVSNGEYQIDAQYFDPESEESGATFYIYRKTPYQKYYDYICSLENGATTLRDYNVANNEYYHYLAATEVKTSSGIKYKIYQNEEETPDNPKYVQDSEGLYYLPVKWDNWQICDIEETDEENTFIKTGNTWNLGLNMEDSSVTQNISVSMWETLGRFDKYSVGQRNYDSSAITCLLGDMQEILHVEGSGNTIISKYEYTEDAYAVSKCDYESELSKASLQSQSRLKAVTRKNLIDNKYQRQYTKTEAWKEFCSNGKLKLLKDIKGNKWICQIQAAPTRTVNGASNYLLTTITFEWREALDASTSVVVQIE